MRRIGSRGFTVSHVTLPIMCKVSAVCARARSGSVALLNQTALPTTIVNPVNGRYERVNQAYCKLLGYSEEELLVQVF